MIEAVSVDGRRVVLHEDGRWAPLEVQRSVGAGFRKTAWGDTIARVKASELAEPSRETDVSLTYEVQIAGLDAIAFYIFVDGVLARGKYILVEEHSNDELFLSDFARLGDLLAQKYGEPDARNDYWLNDLYQDSPGEWGMAVSAGHLSRFLQWDRPDMTVILALTGDNFEVSLEIEYSSPELAGLEQQRSREAALEDL